MTSVRRPAIRAAFTLLELTVSMFIGMAVAVMVLMLTNQQLSFMRIYRAQSFLTEEAPIISTHVRNLVGQADRFRLHRSVGEALAGTNPVMTDAPVLLLNFQQPDGTSRAGILAFQDIGSGPALYYYLVPVAGALGTPQWAVTKKPAGVRFALESGVLRMRLTGPNNEQIIYSGTMQK